MGYGSNEFNVQSPTAAQLLDDGAAALRGVALQVEIRKANFETGFFT
jgi:hypothetical protein